jgi:hypothetical protein
MGLEGLVNGGPITFVRGVEAAYSPADLNVNNRALGGGAQIFSEWANVRGYRNATLWVYMTIALGAPSVDITAHWTAEDNLTNLGTDAITTAFTTGTTWTAFDFGLGTALVPGRVFGQLYFDLQETAGAGNDAALTCRLFARF